MATNGYEWLRMATNGYEWLRMATNGYEWLGLSTNGYECTPFAAIEHATATSPLRTQKQAVKLTSEQAEILLKDHLRNLAKRFQHGTTLSVAERKVLRSALAGENPSAAEFAGSRLETGTHPMMTRAPGPAALNTAARPEPLRPSSGYPDTTARFRECRPRIGAPAPSRVPSQSCPRQWRNGDRGRGDL
jgi:hypothetical protein